MQDYQSETLNMVSSWKGVTNAWFLHIEINLKFIFVHLCCVVCLEYTSL